MAKCQPKKWVPWALLGAGLPFIAAAYLDPSLRSRSLPERIHTEAAKALSANEQTAWAKVRNEGRDFHLEGTAPSQEALDMAVKTVAGTYGVRTLLNTVQIVEPIKLVAPTIESVNATVATPEITGTWQEGVAQTLAVTVGPDTYKLGTNPELTTLAGNWLLKLTKPLAEGSYDLSVESSDGKQSLKSETAAKLVIDLPEPAPVAEPILARPTIENFIGNTATPVLKGTWPEVEAKAAGKNLQIKFNDQLFMLGTAPELTTDGAGKWQLALSKPLPEGEISVMPGIVGADGKWLTAEAPAKVVIDLTPPFVAEVTAPPTDAKWPFAITGKWPEGDGNSLAATLAGATYNLGRDAALTSDGAGNFTFDPKVELAPGSYDVNFAVSDLAGNVVGQTLKNAIVVPEPVVPAKLAAVDPVPQGAVWPYAITGTWDERPGNSLSAELAGRTYVLGRGAAVSSDGAGKFTFAPQARLAPGSYDVKIITNDPTGEAKVTTLAAAVVVPEPVKVEPPKAAEPVVAPVVEAPPPGAVWPYAITGTWDERPGNTLSAELAGRNYVLGRGMALASDGAGKFTFAPQARLAPGSYDVKIITSNAAGDAKETTLAAAVVVPEPVKVEPPKAVEPVVAPVVEAPPPGAVWPYAITGTWDERPGNTLSAELAGRNYVLGRGMALASDGAGKFTFAPQARLAPGSYDVKIITSNAAGDAKETTLAAAVVVPEPPKVEPPPPLPELPVPTVTSQLDLTGAPIIKGTWPNTLATSLSVTLDGRSYVLGRDANLAARDGNWTLLPGSGLKDGVYDVVAEVADSAGTKKQDTTTNELEVDGELPAAPTVMTMAGDKSPDHLSGTWDEAGSKTLRVTIPATNFKAELGAPDSKLTTDGQGKWRLDLSTALPPGTYDIQAESLDRHGRISADVSAAEVQVVEKGRSIVVPPKYDCVAVMNRIGNVFPIRFEFDRTDITKPFDLSVSQYAALLKDPRCTSINIEIRGHADFKGTEIYNMDLSERRADIILNMLKDAGVDAARMGTIGLGESNPLDPDTTDEARMKNRRVEITVKP